MASRPGREVPPSLALRLVDSVRWTGAVVVCAYNFSRSIAFNPNSAYERTLYLQPWRQLIVSKLSPVFAAAGGQKGALCKRIGPFSGDLDIRGLFILCFLNGTGEGAKGGDEKNEKGVKRPNSMNY